MVINASVVCSKRWEKEGRVYNTVTLAVRGLGAMELTVDERIIPNFVDGSKCSLDLGIGISKGKPYVKPDWNTFRIDKEA